MLHRLPTALCAALIALFVTVWSVQMAHAAPKSLFDGFTGALQAIGSPPRKAKRPHRAAKVRAAKPVQVARQAPVVAAPETPYEAATKGTGEDAFAAFAREHMTPPPKPVKASAVVKASWYGGGERLNRHTANGEVFRPTALTCAHRRLPFGTRVKVTHAKTGKSVVCRINDRGPAKYTGRSIDLSRGAATVLGIIRSGEATVRVEVQ